MAGNLEPSGAPGSTMKPLDQVQPRIAITSLPYGITQSGSYYLTKDLNGITDLPGIGIYASNVTLDLSGFSVTVANNIGISGSGTCENVEIRNGTIRNCQYGIFASSSCKGWRILNIRATNNSFTGISVNGTNNTIDHCMVSNNGSASSSEVGIYSGDSSLIINSTARENSHNGIVTGNHCVINNCTAGANGGYGIYTQTSSRVSNCVANSNFSSGFNVGVSSVVSDCTANSNTTTGINTADNCKVSGCLTNGNTGKGIKVTNNSTVTESTCNFNTDDGIAGFDHVAITNNTVSSNGNWGITCTGGYIARNTVSLNNTSNTAGKGGIYASAHSQVKENTLEGNTKNNIYVIGARSSVEGNVMSGSDYGINFGNTGNVYLNNRATANGTNYNVAGNTDGGGNISF